ncbi:hypothetical protein AUR64_11035 [Haloprofundus marisrubri]|uniref:DUF2267 domain-containing protein n=1 Tax=Haloprofundus marisrubri TaxID=1514971 RepID=A0A0W1RA03_9EURY|nr:DUF2267 domain-containing protein [Haloprofundus marisrubri]KTG10122.1 hypothetical protein AUR64_11035 [Haloprofundus marisrubri]
MDHDEFIGQVQNRAGLASRGEATSATRAVLETLGERIGEEEADHVASQLPLEIGRYLDERDHAQQFDYEMFAARVAEKTESSDVEQRPGQTSQAVMSVVSDAVEGGLVRDVVSQLPQSDGYGELMAEAGD